jgi:hypothetical protein
LIVQEEKPSTIKKIIVGIIIVLVIIGVIVAGIAVQIFQKPSSSPYVDVKYETVGWYYTYPLSDNQSCLVLNLTITNKGYTDGIVIYPDYPLSLNGFGLNISNVVYPPISGVSISNSSVWLGYTDISATLPSITILNNGNVTGTIIFEFPKQQYNQPFTLLCSIITVKYETNVRTSVG